MEENEKKTDRKKREAQVELWRGFEIDRLCNAQRKKRFFEAITHLVKNHAMCKSFAHSVFLFMAASSIQV